MAQQQFAFNDVQCKAPDTFQAVIATTSTEDSDRDQSMVMHNTPIGTVYGYDLVWGSLTPAEASAILKQVINKPSFKFYYCDIYHGDWRSNEFYASNFSAPARTLENGIESWDGLAFNIRSKYPL